MKKLFTFSLFIVSLSLMNAGIVTAQKCRYDADMTDPATHVRSRRVHVDLDKRWAILFRQDDTVYSVCLLMNVTDGSSPGKIVKGNMLHVELEDGKLFDLFASEDSKATTREAASGNVPVREVKFIVDKRTLAFFAESGMTGMKLHMADKDQAFSEPDDRTKKLVIKAAQCMMKD